MHACPLCAYPFLTLVDQLVGLIIFRSLVFESFTAPMNLATQALALALYSEQFWPVSAALVAKAMGATAARSCSAGRGNRSFTTASALRTGAVGAPAAVPHIKNALVEAVPATNRGEYNGGEPSLEA